MEGFIGEVKYFAGTYPPNGWAFCEGQSLPITQYTPLYSIIGTQFGGDGKTYFKLPDLRGRMTLGAGQSTGTSFRHQGDTGGYESVQLTQFTLPAHIHTVKCDTASSPAQANANPQNNLFAVESSGKGYGINSTGNPLMKADMINLEGQSQPHGNMAPWQCLYYIICLNGYYPSVPRQDKS